MVYLAKDNHCDVCGKPRTGRKFNHSRCGKIRQKRFEKLNAQRSVRREILEAQRILKTKGSNINQ